LTFVRLLLELRAMGLFDTVVVTDDSMDLRCPYGHALRSFQTKDLDEPSMCTYLIHAGGLYLASPADGRRFREDEARRWRVRGEEAVSEERFKLRAVRPPRGARLYDHCRECAPVLVRTEGMSFFGDIVAEHDLFVEFLLTFPSGEPLRAERTSGTRDALKQELRGRGLCVLDENEPLAIAHREIKAARDRSPRSV
jgi:hypothetical protein